MKKSLFLVVLVVLPLYSFAHGPGMMDFGSLRTGPEMMQYLEDRALGEELHEEMEELMFKMVSGDLNQGEAERLTELMGQYPGPYGMMMNRIGQRGGWNMMSGWDSATGMGFGFWSWLFALSWFVWLAAGLLLVIWLAKKLFD